jgi:quinol monooxygenase YgiN
MSDYIAWIVEAKIKEGCRTDFQKIVEEIVTASKKEGGMLTYQYFVSDDGDVLVFEQFRDVESAHIHITNWGKFADRWLDAALQTRMVHLGNLPDELRKRHAMLTPKLLKPFGGFTRLVEKD